MGYPAGLRWRRPVSQRVERYWRRLILVIVDRIDIGAEEFKEATGWEIKPEGACKGEVCVPLGEDRLRPADDGGAPGHGCGVRARSVGGGARRHSGAER